MKIRKGFVSNSSSTSFCIYGSCIDFKDIAKAASDEDLDILQYGISKNISDKLTSTNLRCYNDYDNSCLYLGLNWQDMLEDETLKEFKNRVKEMLKGLPEPFNNLYIKCYSDWYEQTIENY